MRRMSLTRGVLGLALVAVAAMGSATLAQDASPAAMAGHPLIGAWIVDIDTRDDRGPANVDTFGAEGNALDSFAVGTGAGYVGGHRSIVGQRDIGLVLPGR